MRGSGPTPLRVLEARAARLRMRGSGPTPLRVLEMRGVMRWMCCWLRMMPGTR